MKQNQIPTPCVEEPQKFSETIGFKVLVIVIISLCLLIASAWIFSLLDEREDRQNDAIAEIGEMWSGEQSLAGPIIELSYFSKKNECNCELFILPETMTCGADVKSRTLTRGIFDGVVYNASIAVNGSFDFSSVKELLPDDAVIDWKNTRLNFYVSDLRGIESIADIVINGKEYEFTGNHSSQKSGIYSMENDDTNNYSILQTNINLDNEIGDTVLVPFSFNFSLKGSQSLAFAPVGKSSEINISGDCVTPSFSGMFLPSERDVTNDGFKAKWLLNAINRDYPQIFDSNSYLDNIYKSEVKTELLVPVDTYQKTSRALKYAIIVILLTFIGVLFAETIYKRPIYVFQYLLIGIALILFYTLLLSLAEHMCFGVSYAIASSATILLISLYLYGIVKMRKVAFAIGVLLGLIYAYIFILLSLETFALLAGSVGLFIALATIMYASLKMDWKNKF